MNESTRHSDAPASGLSGQDDKKRQLFLRQKALLDQFLKTGAISKAQYEKSLGDLTQKMGYGG